MGTILEQLADLRLDTGDELAFAVGELFERTLLDKHYGETYADLFCGLELEWPSFPPSIQGGLPVSFSVLLIDICCTEFETLPRTFAAPEGEAENVDTEESARIKRDRAFAFMRLLGHLFLRGLLGLSFLSVVLLRFVLEPTGADASPGEAPARPGSSPTISPPPGTLPVEHEVECACELLRAVGGSLQASPRGERLLSETCERLLKFRNAEIYSKRVQFAIQDVIEFRDRGWEGKAFWSSAKTKDEIREEARREKDHKRSRVGDSPHGANRGNWRQGPGVESSRRSAASTPPPSETDATCRSGSDGEGCCRSRTFRGAKSRTAPEARARAVPRLQLPRPPRPERPCRCRGNGTRAAEAAKDKATAEAGGCWPMPPAPTPEEEKEEEEEDFLDSRALAVAPPGRRQAEVGRKAKDVGQCKGDEEEAAVKEPSSAAKEAHEAKQGTAVLTPRVMETPPEVVTSASSAKAPHVRLSAVTMRPNRWSR